MRTAGAFYAETPHGGGLLWYGASNANWTLTASLTYTRNAAGDYSLNLGAALGPAFITLALADVKRLTIYPDNLSGLASGPANGPNLPFQEAFGTGAGGPAYPAPAPGLPPFPGASQLTPPTTLPPKGLRVWKMNVVYLITGAALTTHTINLYRTTYSNNVANSIASPAISTTALNTATQANPYVQTISVTTPGFEVTDISDLIAEVQVTTATSGAYRFYGIGFYCDFNFN